MGKTYDQLDQRLRDWIADQRMFFVAFHVTEGVGLIQSRGGEVVEIRLVQTTYTPPGEWHWHGAAPDHVMSHLAMWEGPGQGSGPETEWGDHVTDEEYDRR